MTPGGAILNPLEALRARFVRETEAALLLGLLHPESVVRIPTVEVGRGAFSREYAHQFWLDAAGIGYPEEAGAPWTTGS